MSEMLTVNDACWLRDIAEYSSVADDLGDRMLWPEDIANLKRIAALLEGLFDE